MTELLLERRPRRSETIVAPEPLFAGDDQSRAAQVSEMPRRLRLRYAETGDDVANAKFAAAEQLQDAQSRRIREGAEHEVYGSDGGGLHICLGEYIRPADSEQV